MSEQIDKSNRDWLKEIGAESPDAELKKRITELGREVQEYKGGKCPGCYSVLPFTGLSKRQMSSWMRLKKSEAECLVFTAKGKDVLMKEFEKNGRRNATTPKVDLETFTRQRQL